MNKIHSSLVWQLFLLAAFAACKKDETAAPPAIATGTRQELSLDSLFLFARETYLWYDALPDYNTFNPRQYASAGNDLSALQNELNAMAQLPVNPQTGKSYEYRAGYDHPLYSYMAAGNIITGRRAAAGIDGKGNDMGLQLVVMDGNLVYVSYVEPGSPAAQAGITRGMQVTAADGIHVPLNSSLISTLLSGSSLGITIKKQDGSSGHVVLVPQAYKASPVLKSVVLTTGGKKTGYIALSRFSDLNEGQSALEEAFSRFNTEQPTHLIVDLRYNNGGYVETAEYVANLIAPSGINGKVMYEEHYNALLQQGKAPVLRAIPYLDKERNPVYINGRPATYADVDFSVAGNTYKFSKKGGLTSVRSIVFIVSGTTASASELLINSFKPYLEVALAGSKTYGKPVGYFGIGIDLYTAYLSQFRILNANGQGDYYTGMPVDIEAEDDVTKDFGDPAENCLAKALEYIDHTNSRAGNYTRIPNAQANRYVAPPTNPGMKENRLRLR